MKRTLINITADLTVVEATMYSQKLIHESKTNPSETLTNDFWERRIDLVNEKEGLLQELSTLLEFEKAISSLEKRDTNLKIS